MRHFLVTAQSSRIRALCLSCRGIHATGRRAADHWKSMNSALAQVDPKMHEIIEKEKQRQRDSLVLIPSENFTSTAVMQALGSAMQNKYSEGYPGARYYGGNEYIDQSELLCQERALKLFGLNPEEWGVNVQALSGSPANLATYYALIGPNGRLMGLDLPHGGHLSHGYQTPTKKISAVSAYFQTMPYRLHPETHRIDYDKLMDLASAFRPGIIVAGASAYPREIDYKRMREVSDACGSILMADMAHISGLVAAGVMKSPFEFADIVTTTTHKSLRGPRGSMIFFRRGKTGKVDKKTGKPIEFDYEEKINFSVFPGHQGGPHNHTIAALSVALHQAMQPEFCTYQSQVLKNSKVMANRFSELGYELVSGGTDSHLLLMDLKPKGIDGARVEYLLELCNVAANKNTVPGDKSALVPGGLRLGAPAMTTRGFQEKDFVEIANYVDRAIQLTVKLQKHILAKTTDPKKKSTVKDFKTHVNAVLGCGESPIPVDASHRDQVEALRKDVIQFCRKFPLIGFGMFDIEF